MSMDATSLQVVLPPDAPAASPLLSATGDDSTHDERRSQMMLAAISLPQAPVLASDAKLDLDESRSESSNLSSSGEVALALAKTIAGHSPEDSEDDSDDGPDGLGGKGQGVMKRAWQPEEDQQLMQLVTELGPCHWSVIASYLEGRVGKQCRERCAQRKKQALHPALCLFPQCRLRSTLAALCPTAPCRIRPPAAGPLLAWLAITGLRSLSAWPGLALVAKRRFFKKNRDVAVAKAGGLPRLALLRLAAPLPLSPRAPSTCLHCARFALSLSLSPLLFACCPSAS